MPANRLPQSRRSGSVLAEPLEGRQLFAVGPSSGFVAPAMPVATTNTKQIVKVLVMTFDPRVPSQGNLLLHQALNYNDPKTMAAGYEAEMEKAAGGAIDFQVVGWRDVGEIPVFTDGFKYTPDQYYTARSTNSGYHDGTVDVPQLLAQQQIAPLVNAGTVDEVWTFGDHYYLVGGESWMAGPGAFFINGPTYDDAALERPFVGYGFSFERGVAEMIHNTGHRTENHLREAYSGVWNLQDPVSMWDKFAASSLKTTNGRAGVGDTHSPANATFGYDYGSTTIVQSTADDWLNYPNLTGKTKAISRSAWSSGSDPDYQKDYLGWFFGHLPRAAGTTADGRQANWWKYIYDYDDYTLGTGKAKGPRVGGTLTNVTGTAASTYAFSVRFSSAVDVAVSSFDGQDVQVTGPNGFSAAATLVGRSDTTNGHYRVATYQFTAPGGSWDVADNGTYTVALRSGQVRLADGSTIVARNLGTFSAQIASDDLAEANAAKWTTYAEEGSVALTDDTVTKLVGKASLKLVATGGFDTALKYSFPAAVDLSTADTLAISLRSQNANPDQFQNGSPWVMLVDTSGRTAKLQYVIASGDAYDLLNETIGAWKSYRIALAGAAANTAGWKRTVTSGFDIKSVKSLEIHADTWGEGFTLWVDGVGFTRPAGPATGALRGISFDDANKNGAYDAGETKTGGKTIFIDADNDGLLDTDEKSVTSAADGSWQFTGLAAGLYRVRRVFPKGYVASTPLIDVTLSAGQTVSDLLIGSKSGSTPVDPKTASVSGLAFDDKNKNGLLDTGDLAASGKTIWLDLDDDNVKDSTEPSVITAGNGTFSFKNLAAGNYHVRRLFPTGWAESTPARDITLTAKQTVGSVLIGSKAK